MKRWTVFFTFLIIYLSYGVFLNTFTVSILDQSIVDLSRATKYYDYSGVTHVHSSLSTGSSPQEEIILEARDAGLDFIVFTELNFFGKEPRYEGYYEKVLVLQGNEISYLDSHLLLYSLDKKSFETLGEAQVYLSDLISRRRHEHSNEFAVLAHPLKDGYRWSGEYPEGILGIETINLKSIWQSAWKTTRVSFLWSLFIYPFNAQLALTRMYLDPKQEMMLWKQLNERHPTIAILGSDTTAHVFPIGKSFFKFPTYHDSFKIAANHVLLKSELTGNTQGDKEKIFRALINGNFYMCIDLFGNPKGFYAELIDGSDAHLPGSRVKLKTDQQIRVVLPNAPSVPYEIGLIKNGELHKTAHSEIATFDIREKGVYHIVVRAIPTLPLPDGKKWLPWIYTNAFYIL